MIGILAIQGDFAAHGRVLTDLNVRWREVRTVADMNCIEALILPGGESTTMLRLLQQSNLYAAIKTFADNGGSIFGTCAGAILLSKDVSNPHQESLSIIDVAIARNAYGRQVHSFIGSAPSQLGPPNLEMVFIRAPQIQHVGAEVKVLATFDGCPVLIQQGRNLVATFHPELTSDRRVHQHFLQMRAGILPASWTAVFDARPTLKSVFRGVGACAHAAAGRVAGFQPATGVCTFDSIFGKRSNSRIEPCRRGRRGVNAGGR